MWKAVLIFLLLFSIVIWGCSNDKQEIKILKEQNILLQKQINEKNDNKKEEFFEKAKECWSYYNSAKKIIEDDLKNTFFRLGKIIEVNYSPILDTCYIAYSTLMGLETPTIIYKVDDIFTKKTIYQISWLTNEDIEKYLNYIRSLKEDF